MKIINFVTVVTMLLMFNLANAQFTSQIVDKENNDPVPFAAIQILDLGLGTVADSSGHFRFEIGLPENFQMKVSAYGHKTAVFDVNLKEATSLGIVYALEHQHVQFDEVTVSLPRAGLQSKSATHVESRNVEELNTVPATNVGELLSRIPGVYNATSGAGVSKPVIRGMQGTRVVSLLNGVRLENQQWGGDHDVGITDLGIGRVEVIKGPSSLLYGADALGGVVYYSDADYAIYKGFELNMNSQFESNTMGMKNNLLFKFGGKNVRVNVAGNYTNHADYQLPDGHYIENSRFNGNAGKVALGANKGNWVTHVRYLYSASSVGIIGGHHDEHEEGEEEEHEEEHAFEIETQPRGIAVPFQAYENHILSWKNKFFIRGNELMVLLGHSYNSLSEFEETADEATMALKLNNSSYTLRYKHKLDEGFDLIVGAQGGYQTNRNSGSEEQLIPNAQQVDNGAFALLYMSHKKWNFQGGVRYDMRGVYSEMTPDSILPLTERYSGFNFSLGAVHSGKSNTFRVNVSSGFRVPHLSELLSYGEHHGAQRFEVGNRALRSERAFQLDISDEIHGEHMELVINPFVSMVRDYIYLQKTDSIIEELDVYEYSQANYALLFGGDVAAHYHPHFAHWLHWEPSFSYLYAQDQSGGAIPFIPQARITNELRFDIRLKNKEKLLNIVAQHAFFFDQHRVSYLETPSRHYNLVHLGVNFQYFGGLPFELGVGVKNLLNENYVDHLSRLKGMGIANPGRNVYVRLKINLESSLH